MGDILSNNKDKIIYDCNNLVVMFLIDITFDRYLTIIRMKIDQYIVNVMHNKNNTLKSFTIMKNFIKHI